MTVFPWDRDQEGRVYAGEDLFALRWANDCDLFDGEDEDDENAAEREAKEARALGGDANWVGYELFRGLRRGENVVTPTQFVPLVRACISRKDPGYAAALRVGRFEHAGKIVISTRCQMRAFNAA